MPAVLDAKKPKGALACLGKPKRSRFHLERRPVRAVERHADKTVLAERFEQMPYICGSVRVGAASDFVVELLGGLCEKFAIARFRDENVDVLVLEGGAAREQVLVPQSEDARTEILGDA